MYGSKNTCLQGRQSLCAFVVCPGRLLSLCNSASDEMCLKR